MDNKKIPTVAGTTVLAIIAITAIAFVWVYEKIQSWDTVTTQIQALPKTAIGNDEQKNLDTETIVTEPIENWETYQDKKYGFEFRYPKSFSVKITDHYSITNSSGEVAGFVVKKWKDSIIQENAPGTFWEKLSYANWKYFSDNSEKLSSGECDSETLVHVLGSTAVDASKSCSIDKQEKFIRVETEDYIVYFTKDLEIRWNLNKDSSGLVKKIASTLVIK